MTSQSLTTKQLLGSLLAKGISGIFFIALLFFLPRWSLDYWQAWAFLGVLVGCMTATSLYLLRNDRALLERRLRTKEKAGKQKAIILLAVFLILPSYIIPGLDVRFGWSRVPAWLSITALLLFVAGYAIFFLVIRENSYASRVVEVEAGQKVISSGPYGVVRHPMYVGVMLIYLCVPLALGSYWALIPGSLMLVVIVTRLLNEEEILAKELPGYTEYMEKVKHRLIPGVW